MHRIVAVLAQTTVHENKNSLTAREAPWNRDTGNGYPMTRASFIDYPESWQFVIAAMRFAGRL